ncbi:hypothetical protein M0R45_006686 [Rubus argutus]|uniref:Uncharacterized protein n=1 Tax=Rubus argutus TaxID=59490 RepID=A0AAW1YRW9_RUBAR
MAGGNGNSLNGGWRPCGLGKERRSRIHGLMQGLGSGNGETVSGKRGPVMMRAAATGIDWADFRKKRERGD